LNWSCSEPLVVNKSKFKGWCIPIQSNNEIENLLLQLPIIDKQLNKASHPFMLAWKTSQNNNNDIPIPDKKKNKKVKKSQQTQLDNSYKLNKLINVCQGTNDNGEGGSGDRILGLINRLKLVNVLIVVSRWYGGTPLGPTRFKCISDVALQSLQNGGYL
ncbi:hypothetical protein CANARDRAFT_181006, partial [[Candida] arabinofermentans NRRL YB-2248]